MIRARGFVLGLGRCVVLEVEAPLHVVRQRVVGPRVLVVVQEDVAALAALQPPRVLLQGARRVAEALEVGIGPKAVTCQNDGAAVFLTL